MPKALFFPSYHGGGYGHIGRCLALAGALEARGWDTAIALGGQHLQRARRTSTGSPRQIFPLRQPRSDSALSRATAQFMEAPRSVLEHLFKKGFSHTRAGTGPEEQDGLIFTTFSGMNYQLVRDGLISATAIRSSVTEQLVVIRRFRPDVLVSDAWPLASILAHLAGLPLVQITRSITHPAGLQLMWWQELPEGLVPPDPRPLFNPLLQEWGLPAIARAEDLLTGDLHLVPSTPALDPLPAGLENTHYIGPLVHRPSAAVPAWLESLDAGRPVVYLTSGGGAEGVGGLHFYRLLIEALGECDLQVVISTGARCSPAEIATASPAQVLPANVRLEAWVPGPAVIARSSLVLYSGGYGTTMEMVAAGVPGLIIPSHTEQESNARRMVAAGAARLLLPARLPAVLRWHRWPGGYFSTLTHRIGGLTAAGLRKAIQEAIVDPTLPAGALRLQASVRCCQGTDRAGELVEGLV